MLPAAAAERVDHLLSRLDRPLPGRIEGFVVRVINSASGVKDFARGRDK
jgi:hypothetical protein